MQLLLEGVRREFASLKQFRVERNLPDDFNVNLFEPKMWEGLGSMNSKSAAIALTQMKDAVLAKIPPRLRLGELLPLMDTLAFEFEQQFTQANRYIELKEVEIEFAVSGLRDVLRAVGYELTRLWHTHGGDPVVVNAHFNFSDLYQTWLDSSARISAVTHTYTKQNETYEVRVVYNVYGRVGLRVELQGQEFWLSDLALACPAANYMFGLCTEAVQKITTSLLTPVT